MSTTTPISPLRRRMIEDMTVRGFGEKTQSDYICHVKNFTIFLGRSPDTAEGEDLRAFQARQREQGVQPPTMNGAVAALRFVAGSAGDARPRQHRHHVRLSARQARFLERPAARPGSVPSMKLTTNPPANRQTMRMRTLKLWRPQDDSRKLFAGTIVAASPAARDVGRVPGDRRAWLLLRHLPRQLYGARNSIRERDRRQGVGGHIGKGPGEGSLCPRPGVRYSRLASQDVV